MDENNQKQTVHVNTLKKAYDSKTWSLIRKTMIMVPKRLVTLEDEQKEDEMGPIPLWNPRHPEDNLEPKIPPDPTLITPKSNKIAVNTPNSERNDPSYRPPEKPRSSRELQTTRVSHL
jgi:hypothetical protein